MSRWGARIMSIVSILSLAGAFASFTYAIFNASTEWGGFGVLLTLTGIITVAIWLTWVENRRKGAWER